MPFSKSISEVKQPISSRIWTWVANFISYDNHYVLSISGGGGELKKKKKKKNHMTGKFFFPPQQCLMIVFFLFFAKCIKLPVTKDKKQKCYNNHFNFHTALLVSIWGCFFFSSKLKWFVLLYIIFCFVCVIYILHTHKFGWGCRIYWQHLYRGNKPPPQWES